ncbi:MAG: hypothetical protein CMI54_03675 [Parcubacteria group bacterium]|nr:hypothetical protein [Parcubacteria group bacterium]|tara:strand:- start:19936 stop:20835 length:900 start_codon:yes stop_codon:yes gene_type:complete
MQSSLGEKTRERSLADKSISAFNELYFAVTEPLKLKIARLRFENQYLELAENPLISICVPTYNRGELLMERAVKSVLAQSYKNFELIIIGDHCTDNTVELISKINDPRIRFYNIPKRGYRYPPTVKNHWLAGPVVAANQALSMVRGKWIARIDDDDIWTPDHLSLLLDFAQSGNHEFVSALYEEERQGKRRIVDGEPGDGPYFNPKAKEEGLGPKIGGVQTWLYRSYLRFFRYNINCWRKAHNRVNDTDLEIRIYKAGVRMGFLEKVVGYILPRPGEKTVGLSAYKESIKEKEEHFKFN